MGVFVKSDESNKKPESNSTKRVIRIFKLDHHPNTIEEHPNSKLTDNEILSNYGKE